MLPHYLPSCRPKFVKCCPCRATQVYSPHSAYCTSREWLGLTTPLIADDLTAALRTIVQAELRRASLDDARLARVPHIDVDDLAQAITDT